MGRTLEVAEFGKGLKVASGRAGIALSLGLDADYFHSRYTSRPTLLFRIFHYPPSAANEARWGAYR
jgi:isopenicillin N synthase-like dioxygenase